MNQYETKPEIIVAIIFLLKTPIIIATIDAYIFGLFSKSKFPVSLKNIAGNIIAGNIAEGTYAKICLTIGFILLASK